MANNGHIYFGSLEHAERMKLEQGGVGGVVRSRAHDVLLNSLTSLTSTARPRDR